MLEDRYALPPPPPRPWYQRISADRWFSLAAIFAALAAAAFTGWYAWDTHGMRIDAQIAAKKQIDDVKLAREAAQRSADAAVSLAEGMTTSAAAAQKSAALSQAQLENSIALFHIDQRARLDVISVTRETEMEPGKPVRFRSSIRNIGKTHALGFKGQEWIVVLPSFKADYTQKILEQSVRDLAPAAGSGYDVELTLSEQEIQSIRNGNIRIWVYGRASYKDIFDDTTEHELKWCYFYPASGKAAPEIRELQICEQHNSSN